MPGSIIPRGISPVARSISDSSGWSREKTNHGHGYHPEIQGLRAVAVLLVAVYHIWFNRVSGGVDVFLLLTGFLITGSLIRGMEREGRIAFLDFWARLVRRLFPALGTVLLGVVVATFLWMPRNVWRDTLIDVIASMLYAENWVLAMKSVDYQDSLNDASLLQHMWSLGIQGQFYVLWPLLLGVAAVIAARCAWSLRRVAFVGIAGAFSLSFVYSLVITSSDQKWAYFDTGARLWEPALGGILALILPHIAIPRLVRIVLGWAGLLLLVSCGLLVSVSTHFPGYIALWPTGAAVLVLLAGTTGSRLGADRILTWRPLEYVGGIAYPLYLWHWPVLLLYLEVTGRKLASPAGGLAVLAVSIVLAVMTMRLSDGGARLVIRNRTTPARSIAVGVLAFLPALTVTGTWTLELERQQHQRQAAADTTVLYPGAMALDGSSQEATGSPELPVVPDPADRWDHWETHRMGCNQYRTETEAQACVFGSESAEHTIVLIGDSHSGHWSPALRKVARDQDWELKVMTKNACRFDGNTDSLDSECAQWNQNVLDELRADPPDAVITLATVTDEDDGEQMPEGYLKRWRELDSIGIDVIAIRDNPRPGFHVPASVEENGRTTYDADQSMAEESPLQDDQEAPKNVSFIDLTSQFCRQGQCPTVIGNIMVISDDHHISATYARTLAPALESELKSATGW